MGVNNGAGTAYPSGTLGFTPAFNGVRVIQSLVFYVVFCRSTIVCLSSFDHCLLRIADSDYSFGISQLVLLLSIK